MLAGQDQPNMLGDSWKANVSPSTPLQATRNILNHVGWEEPSPKPHFRPSPCKTPNTGVAHITNQRENFQKAHDERAERLASDRNFADLCLQTVETKNTQT